MNKTQPAVQATAAALSVQGSQRLCDLVARMCSLKKEIDRFYDSPDGLIMSQIPDQYLATERKMNEAINHMAEYIGVYTVESLLNYE